MGQAGGPCVILCNACMKLTFHVEFLHASLNTMLVSAQDPFARSSLFQRAVSRIMRPLVRALISQGVTAPVFYQIVKAAYVDVAAEELGEVVNDSRISVMTGVHRRDVKSIRAEDHSEEAAISKKVSNLANVVGRWLSDPDLTDAQGAPRPLPRTDDAGPSFDALVASVSRDVRPRAILDELERQGIVTRKGPLIHLDIEAIVGPADLDQKLYYFSRNVGDHMSVAVENLLTTPSPFLERALYYNNLSETSADALENEVRQSGMRLLKALNTKAAAHQKTDADGADAHHRIRFGMYFFREAEVPPKTRSDEGK